MEAVNNKTLDDIMAAARDALETRKKTPLRVVRDVSDDPKEQRRRAEEARRNVQTALILCGAPKIEATRLAQSQPAIHRPLMPGETTGTGCPEGFTHTAAGLVLAWLDMPQSILVLQGVRSTGKTAAASYFLLEALKRTRVNLAAPLPATRPMFVKARQVYTKAEWDKHALENRLRFHPFLAIDELGGESGDAKRMAGLLDAIYDEGTKLVITTNLLPGGEAEGSIGRAYSQRIWERLTERGLWQVYQGPNMRKLLGPVSDCREELARLGDTELWRRWTNKLRSRAGIEGAR